MDKHRNTKTQNSGELEKRSRNWTFTWNNFECDPINFLIVLSNEPSCTYVIFGEEGYQPGKTPHLQGYLEFKNPVKGWTLHNKWSKIHWEVRINTAQKASDYCRKEGKIHEWGTISKRAQNIVDTMDPEDWMEVKLEILSRLESPHYRGFGN